MADDGGMVEARHVLAGNAVVADFSVMPGSQTKQLTLFYAFSDPKLARVAADYLAAYTSTLNSQARRQWVRDPVCGTEKFPGVYRQVSLRLGKHNDNPGILQVLREGFLQALPKSESQNDESRLLRWSVSPINGKVSLVRYYASVDRERADQFCASLKADTSVTDPVCEVLNYQTDQLFLAGKKRFTGLFAVGRVYCENTVEDVTVDVFEELQEVTEITTVYGLAALTPVVLAENEIRDLFNVSTGEEDRMALQFRYLTAGSRDACMGFYGSRTYVAWLTARYYLVGDTVTWGGNRYVCLVAHVSGTFTTDHTAGKWDTATELLEDLAYRDFSAWVQATAYTVGLLRTSGGARYRCALPHTASTTFSDDLAKGWWVAAPDWHYAERKFTVQEDGTGTFTVLYRRPKQTAVTVIGNLSDLAPEILQENEVKELFSTGTGESETVALRYRHLSLGSRAFCMGLPDAMLTSVLGNADYIPWLTTTAYVVGSLVSNGGYRYRCLTAHTSGTFATDWAAGKWRLVTSTWGGLYWLTTTAYVVGDIVHFMTAASGPVLRYRCVIAHTSGTFATDLGNGIWEVWPTWSYADRRWDRDDDGTGVLTILFSALTWQSGDANADAHIVEHRASVGAQPAGLTRVWPRRTLAAKMSLLVLPADTATAWVTVTAYAYAAVVATGGAAYVCLIAHTSGTFATDLSAGYWKACTGLARTAFTYLGTAYTHLGADAPEVQGGAHTVTQTLIIPRSYASWEDNEGEVVVDMREDVIQTTSVGGWTLYLRVTTRQIYSNPTDAATFAYASDQTAFEAESHVKRRLGYVTYLGNGKHAGIKVKFYAVAANWAYTP